MDNCTFISGKDTDRQGNSAVCQNNLRDSDNPLILHRKKQKNNDY